MNIIESAAIYVAHGTPNLVSTRLLRDEADRPDRLQPNRLTGFGMMHRRALSLVFTTFLAVILGCGNVAEDSISGTPDPRTRRVVERVIDGDTIVLKGGERVRLIGVDTPETVHPSKPVERFGKEASAFTRRMPDGKAVRLEHEPGSRVDRYGRTLAYVYLEDGTLVNLEIILQGYGHAYTRFPFSKMRRFVEAEREAREGGRGLWKADAE